VSRISVVFTGGTISMLPDTAAGGLVPALSGAELLARTPGTQAIADLEPVDWGRLPASHLALGQVLEIAALVREALSRPDIDGAVVVQGTDVMDETAFAYDLLLGSSKPVAVTGAMRGADSPEADGPRNLRAAIRTAASASMRDQGVVVVMDGRILPADDVQKMHTTAIAAFQAPNDGPLGTVDDRGIGLVRRRGKRRVLPTVPSQAVEPIPIVYAYLGSDGSMLRLALQAGARGLVVAGTGSGNTHPDLLAAASQAMESGLPVVLASRCPSGPVTAGYGFPGGGAAWRRAGAITAGRLGPTKARLALALGLGCGLEVGGLGRLVAEP
jgi:L-asparaginase